MDAERRFDLVVIGASWGGLDAIGRVLSGLPADFGCAVAVVQHRNERESPLAALLGRRTAWPVREACDKEPVQPGVLVVAPPGYHLLVESGAFALSTDAPVQFSRPSIDVLFASAADAYREHAVGVVLTGANADGAIGVRRIQDRGGHVIVQDPSTAHRSAMPAAAIEACAPDDVLPLEAIAGRLVELCGGGTHTAGGTSDDVWQRTETGT
jgi:two-component system chemotaxis response regulator CheB